MRARRNILTGCGKPTCPLIAAIVLNLAAEQVADDHDAVEGFAQADYHDRPLEVDRTYDLDQVTEHELAVNWWEETNLSMWYDIETS